MADTTLYKDNPNRLVYAIDFDGTLTSPSVDYANPEPQYSIIDKVRKLYYTGHIILIWSARTWREANILAAFLERYDVPYHGLRLNKGGADIYIDDKNKSLEDFLKEV